MSTNSSKGDVATVFDYDVSSMYAAVGDISYISESVVRGNSQSFDGESVGLKISDLRIAQYVDDIKPAAQ